MILKQNAQSSKIFVDTGLDCYRMTTSDNETQRGKRNEHQRQIPGRNGIDRNERIYYWYPFACCRFYRQVF